MKIRINNVPGYAAGEVVTLKVDSAGVPIDKSWRRRLKDAEIDQCVEVIKDKQSRKEPQQ